MERTIRLVLAYDGTGFRGWAEQGDPSIRTVAGVLRDHLERVLLTRPVLSVAGRTDAGVHARGQVVSFLTGAAVSPERLAKALNSALAPEVVVRESSVAPASFSARFSATARVYTYRVDTGILPDPFTARYVWHRPGALRLHAMRSAASMLLGEHDFASFCRKPSAGKSTVRTMQRATVRKEGDRVEFGFRADSFLHQLVRSLVGTLVAVGAGKLAPEDVDRILTTRDRLAAKGRLAPAHGLTLERVVYGGRR